MNEISVLKLLRSYIASNVNSYIPSTSDTSITDKDVFIGEIDDDRLDNGRYGIFLNWTGASYMNSTTMEDEVTMTFSASILCLQEEEEVLERRAFELKDALYSLLQHKSLGGEIEWCEIQGVKYYPQLFAEFGICGMEIDGELVYTSHFN